MLDTYRELEQQGVRVTELPDRVRCEYPDGWRWDHYHTGLLAGLGPSLYPLLEEDEPAPARPRFWQRLARWLKRRR